MQFSRPPISTICANACLRGHGLLLPLASMTCKCCFFVRVKASLGWCLATARWDML